MSKILLDIQNLHVYYRTDMGDVRAVDGVTLNVERGEIFGVVGESACGKSTMSRSILRLIRDPCYIKNGSVILDGRNILDLDEENLRKLRWNKISYVPQSAMNALNPILKIKDQIADAITTHKEVKEDEILSMSTDAMNIVNLPSEVLDMYPHELSGGMKLRVVIGMSLVLKPSLIVMDEPTTALDVVIQRSVLETIIDLKQKTGSSILLITHSIAVISEIADKVAVMYAGKIEEIAPVYYLFKNPMHPYTKGLMDATPSLGEKKIIMGLPGLPPSLLNPPSGCRFHPRCPQAMAICMREEPPLIEVEPDRLVACHLYGGKSI